MQIRVPRWNGTVRRALPADQAAIEKLLAAARLPVEGVGTFLADFFVAEDAGQIVGAVGLERYGTCGMLRSLVVRAGRRGQGLGSALSQQLLEHSDGSGLIETYLLASTAVTFFPRFGFVDIEREQVPPDVQRSRDFLDTSPASAVVMRRSLR